MTLLDTAAAWYYADVTPLPVRPGGSKAPAVHSWTQWQQRRPNADELQQIFTVDHDGIGVVTGAISGNLEMLELEGRAVAEQLHEQLKQVFINHDRLDLWERITGGYSEITPSGGLHVYYRTAGAVLPNTKLACRPASAEELAENPRDKLKVLIETRGEGGFSVVAPSSGRTHSTGKAWVTVQGSIATLPVISDADRDFVHDMCRLLDQMPAQDSPAPPPSKPASQGLRPGDDFNARASWDEILTPHGWQRAGGQGKEVAWTRPGKNKRDGISATTGHSNDGADRLYVFSSSTEFAQEVPYTKFGAYALLEHGGDHAAAASALRERGYGDPLNQNSVLDLLPVPAPPPTVDSPPVAPSRSLKLTRASQIEARTVVWVWQDEHAGRIPAGELVTAAGREGTGKSSFGVWLAANITRGTLPGSLHGRPRNVFWCSVEESWEYALIPRLTAAGADLDRIYRLEVERVEGEEVQLTLPVDNVLLEQGIVDNEVALVVCDPLMSLLSPGLNANSTQDVRRALDPLSKVAQRTGAVVLAIAHFSKAAGSDAAQLITGAGAWKDAPRAIFGFAKDKRTGQRTFTQVKNSLGPCDDLPSYNYRIEPARVETRDGESSTARFVLEDTTHRTVADLLAEQDDAGGSSEAEDALVELLRKNGGAASSKECRQLLREVGGPVADASVVRLRNRLGIKAEKLGMTGGWVWSLEDAHKPDASKWDWPPKVEESEESTEQSATGYPDSSDSSGEPDTLPEPPETACSVCSKPLARFLIRLGQTTHANCEPTPERNPQ